VWRAWKREFKLPWCEAGPPKTSVDPDQEVVNKELSLSVGGAVQRRGGWS